MLLNGFVLAVALLFFSGLPALIVGRNGKMAERLSAVLLVAGALLGLFVTGAALLNSPTLLSVYWEMPGGRLLVSMDGIAAVFLFPAFLIIGLGGIYGLEYWPVARHGRSALRLRLIYGILGAAIVLLPVSRNAILFLVAWEIMALCGFLLILTEAEQDEARQAAGLYLFATHTGTLALFAFFILLAGQTGSFDFPAAAVLDGNGPLAQALFLLALFGFGLKAGIMPFHIWLPGAHAAAPSHVSALMSGVMIKMGIYGLVRTLSFFQTIPAWWGWLVLALGVVSGVMGVVYAIAQHDLKRLLAYHSVENIGIILIGLGVALLGVSSGNAVLVTLGLAGALLHVINHGLFKALLFLSGGAVIQATGSRHIDSMGGLLSKMPKTAFFFLAGAVAICGLPPLNGFVSEWLVYLGLFGAGLGVDSEQALAVLAAPALAMIGALAVACFVKVFGVVFLGQARSAKAARVIEVGPAMLLPMTVLFAVCLLIGVLPGITLPLLRQAMRDFSPLCLTGTDFAGLAPVGAISIGALLLLLLAGGVGLWQRRAQRSRMPGSQPTWGCGYIAATPRMQYTASSFAAMLVELFHWGLLTDIREGGRAIGFFPRRAGIASVTPDVVLDRLLYPACRFLGRVALAARQFLQHGIIGIYLLYSALTLIFLLFFVLRFTD